MSIPGPEFDMNVDEVEQALLELIDGFGFDASVEGKAVALDVADAFALGVNAMVGDQKILGGQPMPPLDWFYSEEKAKDYGFDIAGYRTGQMLSMVSLIGKLDISRDLLVISYGTGMPPTRGSGPTGYISEEDKEVTDTEKAGWFQEGFVGTVSYTTRSGKSVSYEVNRPPRPFYGVEPETEAMIVEVIQDNLHKYITQFWG